MTIIGPSFPVERPTMAKAKQVEAAALACPSVAQFFAGHPNGFDPVNDLNAMKELEKFLDATQTDRYLDILTIYSGDIRQAALAPASERLDAWLHVKGLWVSDPPADPPADPPISLSGKPDSKGVPS